MKIIRLEASNLKALRAVEVTPDGNVVTITGRNGSGKSSLLDSIYWALAGQAAIDPAPIRKGESKALVKLDLGEVLVERRFTEKGSTLYVESRDGARFPSPQTMLDAMVGELSFDPLEFARRPPKEQVAMLRKAVASDVDFDGLERQRKELYDRRRDLNRDAKRERTLADQVEVPAGAPENPVDVRALAERASEARAHNERVAHNREKRTRLEREFDELDRRLREVVEELNALPKAGEEVDAAAVQAELERAQTANAAVEKRRERERHRKEADRLEKEAARLTGDMEAIDQTKKNAIAKANLPIEGLGWYEDSIILDGNPFEQASSAEQIRAGLAIAMAANPKIRVIRIKEGSFLDDEGLRLIGELAEARDFQVWIECVRSDAPTAILIEDGRIMAKEAAE